MQWHLATITQVQKRKLFDNLKARKQHRLLSRALQAWQYIASQLQFYRLAYLISLLEHCRQALQQSSQPLKWPGTAISLYCIRERFPAEMKGCKATVLVHTSLVRNVSMCRTVVLPHLAKRRIQFLLNCLRAWSRASHQSHSLRACLEKICKKAAGRRLLEAWLAWRHCTHLRSRLRAVAKTIQSRCQSHVSCFWAPSNQEVQF